MNQLFLITWRWLKRDKKRTALTFASIMLSVFLISFVGVYMSTALNALHAKIEFTSPEHATLSPETIEQAKTLDKNAVWDSHLLSVRDYTFIFTDFVKKYADDDRSCFPTVSINGQDILSDGGDPDISAILIDGDADKLIPQSKLNLTGLLPQNAHEAAVSRTFAEQYGGLDIGDTVTIRYEVRGGKLFISDYDEEQLNEWKYIPIRDDNGEVIYNEDTDGSRLKEIYAAMTDYEGDVSNMSCLVFWDFYLKQNGLDPLDYVEMELNDLPVPPAYVELSDEVIDSFEYTATITGIADAGAYGSFCDIAFNANDSDILPLFEESSILYYDVRVKSGIDAEEAIIQAVKNLGIYSEDEPHYELNLELLQLEGRQLEYLDNLGGLIVIAVVVMGLFMFLARLIINNAFEISAAYRTEQYGALKTVGASDKQIFAMIMFECVMYMLIALPAGMGMAVLLGRILLQQIRAIKVFDPIYGAGVSDKFFTLELSPAVMWLTFGCALFSVFFSAYADAMRVKRMPPIQSVGYRTSKRSILRRDLWLSRRFFGYPFGFAVKCISKQKVRFAVTLLASLISGVLIMTLTCVAENYSDKEAEKAGITEIREDLSIYFTSYEGRTADVTVKQYDDMMATGYFEDIYPSMFMLVRNGEPSEEFDVLLSEDFKALCDKYDMENVPVMINAITRDQFDKYITADMSYDDLLASGKLLLCKSVCVGYFDDKDYEKYLSGQTITARYRDRYENVAFIAAEAFGTDNITSLDLTATYSNFDEETGERSDDIVTNHLDIAGLYTTQNQQFATYAPYLGAIIPIENFSNDLLESTVEGYDNILADGYNHGYTFYAKNDKKSEARAYVMSVFNNDMEDYNDYTTLDAYEKNGVRAMKIAGFGFAGVLAAVVLLNIFSTMSANMINRRRDLSMMRSCGMSMRQVRQSLIIESGFYAVITTLVSSVAGWLLGSSITLVIQRDSLDMQNIFMNTSSFSWLACLILFAVIMLTMAAAYLPGLAAMSKRNIAEEIRTDM